jgi:hypothetical protein
LRPFFNGLSDTLFAALRTVLDAAFRFIVITLSLRLLL